ncbi:MAG: GNAT family N-acetyltransferase [Rhizobiales bacterium]|nr:GNAT family N-acetyltransferase [Hyphomicrobiales bacterium]|tara:strand:- start:857 stop:1399 length:543 start_codon:yes stop_codon:yes gene_type:complete
MLSLRPASSSDVPRLAEIGLSAWELAVSDWGENPETLRESAEAAYANFCTEHWTEILIGEWDGETAGWGACENADDLVTDLWVLPAFQSRGIGTRLLAHLEQEIAKRGYHHARIDTHAGNLRAIKLFKELGYHVHAYAVSYTPVLDRDVDKVEMIKTFDHHDEIEEILESDDGLYGVTGS